MERWFWVLGKRNIVNDGRSFPIADNWDEITSSIMSYPFKPSLIGRDRDKPSVHNEQTAPEWGRVMEWKVVSKDEAKLAGLKQDQVDDFALYAKVKVDTDEKIGYVSPFLQLNYTDEEGIKRPAIIRHVAACVVPKQQLGQPHQSELESLSLSSMVVDDGIMLSEVDDFHLNDLQNTMKKLSDVIRGLQAASDGVASKFGQLEAEKAMDIETKEPEVPEETKEPEGQAEQNDGELKDLFSAVTSLRQIIAQLTESVKSMTGKPKEDSVPKSDSDDLAAAQTRIKELETLLYERDVNEAVTRLGLPKGIAMSARLKLGNDEWNAFIARPEDESGPPSEVRLSATTGNEMDKAALSEEDSVALAHKIALRDKINILDAIEYVEGGGR